MDILRLGYRIVQRFQLFSIFLVFQYPRIVKYIFLSDCKKIQGKPKLYQPVLFTGNGLISFGQNVALGVIRSPFCYNGYIYIDARKKESIISFEENIWINNSCSFISEGSGIEIGSDTIMGTNCEFIDSDFHALDPQTRRQGGIPKTAKITVGKNVFFGSNVKVMKGVVIGNNSVIANSSVVTKSIPANVVAGGNPAKILRYL